MQFDTVSLDPATYAVMRRAVDYAVQDQTPLVDPRHILLSLLDDDSIAPAFADRLERESVLASLHAPRPRPEWDPESRDPAAAAPTEPPEEYPTLAFRSVSGSHLRWLDSTAYHVFLEGARRINRGVYEPKHIALGYVAEALRDKELLATLGPKGKEIVAAVWAL